MTMGEPTDYQIWRGAHGVQHGHCPEGCENPQPYEHDGELICGLCAAFSDRRSIMIPCHPEICPE